MILMRWLHISDLHINPDGIMVDVEALMERFLSDLEKRLSEKPIDCIVFTGDLFNRGAWTSSQTSDAKDILKRIYKVCSSAGGWLWEDGQPMNRLFYCPGNHDVLREAYTVCNNNHVIHRKNIVTKAARAVKNGQFAASNDEYVLLTEKTFGQFYTAMQDLCGDNTYISDYEYEYRIFNIETDGNSFSFIGINTALLAAQDFDDRVITDELQSAFNEFMNYHTSFDSKKALEAYKKYDVAVNKKLGKLKNDKNNLCFISTKAQSAIQATPIKDRITVLFGHHPISFLSKEASDWARLTAEKNAVCLYLCGHMHKPHGDTVEASYESYLGKLSENSQVYQVTVGGLFTDKSGYNEISYSIGELDCTDGTHLTINISIFVYTKDIFGEIKWHTTSKTDTITIKKKPEATTAGREESYINNEEIGVKTLHSSNNSDLSNVKEKNEQTISAQGDKVFRSIITSIFSHGSDKEKGDYE